MNLVRATHDTGTAIVGWVRTVVAAAPCRRVRRDWRLLALLAFGVLLYWTAWVSDDAFISYRTIDNAVAGYGLRWNVAERVQTFTHPLWLFLLLGAYRLTGEIFYTALYVSIGISLGVLGLLLWTRMGGPREKWLAVVLVCFSKAFVDYSTSGLENPLTHLLLALFAVTFLADRPFKSRFLVLSALAGLAALTRLDAVLFYLPALALAFPWHTPWRGASRLAIGWLPLLAWEAFSILYYGFPFPNTAYAKLNVGHLGGWRGMEIGLDYLRSSYYMDPLTLGTLGLALVLAFVYRDIRRLALLAGAVAYLGYLVSAGGDFMGGRFISAAFLVAVACLATSRWLESRTVQVVAWSLTLALALAGDFPPPFTDASYGSPDSRAKIRDSFGFHDERAHFFQMSSLAHANRMNPYQGNHPWAVGGHRAKAKGPGVEQIDAVGYAGFFAGPAVHIIDRWAIGDPLLARLKPQGGSIGHFSRVVPKGYLETLKTGRNVIEHPSLAAYYDRLALVIRGPLWSKERLREVVRFNLGRNDDLIDSYSYLRGPVFERRIQITNVSGHKRIELYVWHDWKVSTFLVDADSQTGRSYSCEVRVTATGVSVSPALPELTRLDALDKQGGFTLSVALKDGAHPAATDLYERRYTYFTEGQHLVVLRDPVTVVHRGFPGGEWKEEPIDDVLADVPDEQGSREPAQR